MAEPVIGSVRVDVARCREIGLDPEIALDQELASLRADMLDAIRAAEEVSDGPVSD